MKRTFALVATVCLLAASPRHVLTADYWMGYAGTKNVSADDAARALSWVETDNKGSAMIAPLGVKTLMYTNPNRVKPGEPLFSQDESIYAHTCDGRRARGESQYAGLALTNPASTALAGSLRSSIAKHAEGGHFDAVFFDEAVGAAYAADRPCNYDLNRWLADENNLIAAVSYPVIYNGLNDFAGHGIAPEMALNLHAAGGMMEECYARLKPDHRVGGWQWWSTELTELTMAQQHKLFFCYGRDLTPAEQARDSRLYTYASFLLTYDPRTTVLWEYYKTATGAHVMPETQLVALDPVKQVTRVAELHTASGNYVREYRSCSIAGRPVGPCAAAVNPDDVPHALTLGTYRRTLRLNGSGIFDGGSISTDGGTPPAELSPGGAVIALK